LRADASCQHPTPDKSTAKAKRGRKTTEDTAEIMITNGIDTMETVKNIIMKIDSDTTYYYRDHINNKPNMDKCNTALYETIVEEK
jgi:hypothetical protein